jgi:hypothetical protein
MTPQRRSGLRASALVCMCLAIFPAVALAQDDAFRRGLDARNNKRWQDVVTQMRLAIQQDSTESPRKVGTGLRRLIGQGTEYMPHYFLGEALFNLQDCVGAVDAWTISEQQAAVRARRDFVDTMQSGYTACAAKGILLPADYNQVLSATRQRVTEVGILAQRVSTLGQTHPEAWRSGTNADQYERARGELTTSQARLTTATRARSAADFTDARAAADRAEGILKGIETNLNAAIETQTVVQRQVREVENLIAGAESLDRSIENMRGSFSSTFATSRQTARDLLVRAREGARTAERTQNIGATSEAFKAAQEASAIFSQLLEEARKLARAAIEKQLGDALAAATDALSFLDTTLVTFDRLSSEKVATPETSSRREALQKRLAAIRRRFETAQRTENLPGLQESARLASELRGELDTLMKSLGPLTLRDRGVHASLEEGARLFFNGEYEQAVAALDPDTLGDVPLRAHAHLFRAAALYYLFMRSRESNQSLLSQAVAEIERCRQISPTLQPDPRAFAPRFIEFFQNGGAGGRQAGSGGPSPNKP